MSNDQENIAKLLDEADKLHKLAMRGKGLRDRLKTAGGVDEIRDIIGELSGIASEASLLGGDHSEVNSVVAPAITAAYTMIDDVQRDESNKQLSSSVGEAFKGLVIGGMSELAQKFFAESFKSGVDYHTVQVGRDAKVDTSGKAGDTVNGDELQDHFARLGFHSNDKKKQKAIRDALGEKEPESDEEKLKQWKLEAQALHKALHKMEEYKAHIIMHSGGSEAERHAKLQENHDKFMKAHGQVNDILATHEQLLSTPPDMKASVEKALVEQKAALGTTLKEEVIEQALMGITSFQNALSGGVSVVNAISGLLNSITGINGKSGVSPD